MPYKDPSAATLARRRYYLANRAYLLAQQAARRAAEPNRAREYNAAHRDEIARQRADAAAKRRAYVARLKAKPCMDCGGSFPPECMDFDHVSGKKVRDISKMLLWRTDRLHDELAKCEVVCANCHRIRTAKQRSDAKKVIGKAMQLKEAVA